MAFLAFLDTCVLFSATLTDTLLRIAEEDAFCPQWSEGVLAELQTVLEPTPATPSLEADLTFLDDPDRAKSDQVEAVIGELSGFHQENVRVINTVLEAA